MIGVRIILGILYIFIYLFMIEFMYDNDIYVGYNEGRIFSYGKVVIILLIQP